MNLKSKLLLAGCICITLVSYPTSAAYGQTEGCCLPDDTCMNATVLSCTIDLGGTPMGAGTVCLGDNNADGFDDLCVSPIIISEYYESAPGTRKCIELFNTGTVDFDLGANGYSLATYTDACLNTGDRVADARGVYKFGTLAAGGHAPEVVPAGGVYVVCAVDNADGIPIDLLLPFDGATCVPVPCNYMGGGCGGTVGSPIAANNGNDAIVLFGHDISTPLDNVVDTFGVPFEPVTTGFPRAQFPSSRPYADAAWERRFTVTRGVSDFFGFDSCNFDGLKNCTLLECPPFTPNNVNLACQNALDISTSNQWLFEGLNPSTSNTNHTLGSHLPDSPPIASSIRAITRLDTSVVFNLAVIDIDGDAINVIVDTLPATGSIFDGATQILAVPHTMSDPANPAITFVPAAGVGTDTSIDYHGEQITPVQVGNTATASILVEDESVLMTEVLYDPNSAVPESQWEWVEIFNTTGGTITLGELNSNGCPASICGNNLLVGGAGGTPTSIGPGEIKVIVGNSSNFGGGVARTDQAFLDLWGLSASQVVFIDSTGGAFPFLSNAGAELFLSDANGDLIDFLPNYGATPFPAGVAGSSIFLTSTALDNNDGLNWASALVDCATGFREVSDTSVGSPGAVPGAAASVLPPCAFGGLSFTQVGAPTTKTITLQGTLGGNAPVGATLGFRITALPFIDVAGFPEGLGELHDGPTAAGPLLGLNSLVTDPGGQVTFVENSGVRHFFNFQFKAVEQLMGGGTGAESNAALQTIAVQSNSVVITEIMANPANTSPPTSTDETYWEYLEVRNTSGSPVTLGSMQSTNGVVGNDGNLTGVPNIVIPANTTRLIARDALDASTDPMLGVRTRAAFEAEWATAPLTATDVIYVPNASGPGGNQWDGLTNNPLAPGRFITVWDNTNDFFTSGLLDVVAYQIGQNGWPANTEPNSIFYRGDANGAPFTTTGNDLAASWQESTAGCSGDASFDSVANILMGDTTVDHGSPLALPTNPDLCLPVTCNTCLGDINGDGFLNGSDIQGFVDTATAPGFPLVGCADMNGDGNALDYLPDVALFVDALVSNNGAACPVMTVHSTDITISLTGAPVAGDIELFIGGCDPALACDTLATPSFICFERVTVAPATTAVQLAEELAFGLDRVKDGLGGLDEFCLANGADVNVAGSTISIVFTRAAGQPIPCCYLQDTDGRFSVVAPFDFVLLGGPANCVVTNLLNGTMGDEGAAQVGGFMFTKVGD